MCWQTEATEGVVRNLVPDFNSSVDCHCLQECNRSRVVQASTGAILSHSYNTELQRGGQSGAGLWSVVSGPPSIFAKFMVRVEIHLNVQSPNQS